MQSIFKDAAMNTAFDALRTGWPGALEHITAASSIEQRDVHARLKTEVLGLAPPNSTYAPSFEEAELDICSLKPSYRHVGVEKEQLCGVRAMLKSTMQIAAISVCELLAYLHAQKVDNINLKLVQSFLQEASEEELNRVAKAVSCLHTTAVDGTAVVIPMGYMVVETSLACSYVLRGVVKTSPCPSRTFFALVTLCKCLNLSKEKMLEMETMLKYFTSAAQHVVGDDKDNGHEDNDDADQHIDSPSIKRVKIAPCEP